MRMFIDTSSLIKRFIEENGSEKVDELFENCACIIISDITSLEFAAAINRKLYEKTIDRNSIASIENEYKIESADFEIIKISDQLKNIASGLIKKHGMKTLDSIQLAAAILADADLFVTSDNKLYTSAVLELKNENIFI